MATGFFRVWSFVIRFPGQGIGALALAQGVCAGSGLILQAAAAWSMSPAGYWRFASANTLSLMLLVAAVGLTPKQLRRMVGWHPQSARRALEIIHRRHAPFCAAVAILLIATSGMIARGFGDPGLQTAIAASAVDLVLRAGLLEPYLHLFNGLGRQVTQSCLMSFHGVVRGLTILLLALGGVGPVGGLLGMAFASALAICLAWLCLAKLKQGDGNRFDEHGFDSGSAALGSNRKQAFATLGFDVGVQALLLLSMGFVQRGEADAVLLARFAASLVVARLALTLGTAVEGGIFAVVARSHSTGDHHLAANALRQGLRLLALGYCPCAGWLWYRGAVVLSWLDGEVQASGHFLPAMLFAALSILAVGSLLADALVALGEDFVRLLAVTLALAVALVLGTSLVTAFGGTGGAAVLGISASVLAGTTGSAVRRRLGDYVPWPSVVRATGATLGSCLILQSFPCPFALELFLGAALYVSTLAICGEFRALPERSRCEIP